MEQLKNELQKKLKRELILAYIKLVSGCAEIIFWFTLGWLIIFNHIQIIIK